ncbi:MAG TPA: PRC-barrel domain-containing protein [Streptosporangiaceae bacterium]|nr:PRC-barrel domain-containing protein [Streptosporangiaceae bacterium]
MLAVTPEGSCPPSAEGEAAMAAETEFTVGAQAYCSDGFCGEVIRIVFDPAAGAVTHLAIEPKRRPEAGRLVPIGLAEPSDGAIRLRCTLAEFGKLDPAEDIQVVQGYQGGYGEAEAVQGYGDVGGMGVGGSVSGMGIPMGVPHEVKTVVEEVVPVGETAVSRGDHVYAADGEVGRVHGFLVDPDSHQATHVVLQEGHLWGRKEVAIPMSAVKDVDDGIRLSITKQQVGELPPIG